MTKKTTSKEKKRLIIISLTIIVLLVYLCLNVYSDFNRIKENKVTAAALKSEYNALLQEEEKLSSEVTKMQASDYIARYAKEKFMYSSDDEIIIRID